MEIRPQPRRLPRVPPPPHNLSPLSSCCLCRGCGLSCLSPLIKKTKEVFPGRARKESPCAGSQAVCLNLITHGFLPLPLAPPTGASGGGTEGMEARYPLHPGLRENHPLLPVPVPFTFGLFKNRAHLPSGKTSQKTRIPPRQSLDFFKLWFGEKPKSGCGPDLLSG